MAKAAPTTDLDLAVTRIFAAPRDLVFKMWAEPHHMQRWGCPEGFTSTEGEMDFREGGRWRAVMRSPEGKDLHLAGVYREIVKPARIVFTHAWLDEHGKPGPETLVTVTFAEESGKTKMTFQQSGFTSKDSRDGHEGGWTESFEKLHAFIDVLKHSDREMVITRVITAPIATAFAAFSDRDNIGKWWGPNGFTTTTHEMDFRVGGVWRYTMHGPDGADYQNYVTYAEIEKPSRIAYEHGSNPQHPSEFRAVITFKPQGAGTEVSLRMIIGSAEERDHYVKFGAIEGGQQTLERLAQYLKGSPS